MFKTVLLLVTLGVFSFVKADENNRVKFQNDDVVCFVGNSITHGGAYHAFLHTYMATHFPETKLSFHNCGVSGDNSGGMLKRFEEDVQVHKPTHAFLMTGMNDMWSHLYQTNNPDSLVIRERKRSMEMYYSNTEKLVQMMLENNIQPILLTPTIYDETAKIELKSLIGKNKALTSCAVHIQNLGEHYDCVVVDFNTMMNEVNLQGQKTDPEFTIVGKDRVHPGDPGHWLMAFEIMRTMFSSHLSVSTIEIDAKSNKILKSQNCKVKSKGENSYKVLEKSLPYPFRKNLKGTMDMVNPPIEFNKQFFKVTNLQDGEYKLKIDDVEIGPFSNKELSIGINLSQYQTPQMQQAQKVNEVCFEYRKAQGKLRNLYLIEFRNLANYNGDGTLGDKKKYLEAECEKQKGKSWYDYQVRTVKEYFENIDKKGQYIEEAQKISEQIYEVNKPQWHTYQLIREN